MIIYTYENSDFKQQKEQYLELDYEMIKSFREILQRKDIHKIKILEIKIDKIK
jgi:hypothetical protein